jgi:hypothetical protein
VYVYSVWCLILQKPTASTVSSVIKYKHHLLTFCVAVAMNFNSLVFQPTQNLSFCQRSRKCILHSKCTIQPGKRTALQVHSTFSTHHLSRGYTLKLDGEKLKVRLLQRRIKLVLYRIKMCFFDCFSMKSLMPGISYSLI